MGMQLTYRRMSEAELSNLESDPVRAMMLFLESPEITTDQTVNPSSADSSGSSYFALDEYWHAMHFLLTGDPSMEAVHDESDPLNNVVMGGHPTEIPSTFGPARCLSQVDVSDIVAALEDISVEDLRVKFSIEEFNSLEIYPDPQPSGWTEEDVEGLFVLFPKLKKYFEDALEANEVVLLFTT